MTFKRKNMRFPPDVQEVELQSPRGTETAKVLDFSNGGLGIEVDTAFGLAKGTDVQVCYKGAWMSGTVANVAKLESGFKVGIRWVAQSHSPDDEATLAV